MSGKFYRSTCEKCGMTIDSTYCRQITEGYICEVCYELHPIKYWFLRAIHLSGATILRRFHSNKISNAVKLLGTNGWAPSELYQIKFSEPDVMEEMTRVRTTGKEVVNA